MERFIGYIKKKSSVVDQIIFLLEILRINILKALRWAVMKRSITFFFSKWRVFPNPFVHRICFSQNSN